MKPITFSGASERSVLRIPIDHIRPSPYQPRREFSEASIEELADSIRRHGLLSPLLVRRIAADRWELIAGERRLRALTLLNRTHADAVILTAFDSECALLALVENLQRENLHYLDEAEAFRAILDSRDVTQDALAHSLSMSPSALANRLRLLRLPDAVRSSLRSAGLSERHARALLRLSDEPAQLRLISEACAMKLSVKQLEDRIRRTLAASGRSGQRIVHRVRDNRIVINALLDTVQELRKIGVRADSRIEAHEDSVDVIVTIRTKE